MDSVHDDRYIIFFRFDPSQAKSFAGGGEQPLASCSTYDEARRIRRALQAAGTGDCVIRFVGTSGGGD